MSRRGEPGRCGVRMVLARGGMTRISVLIWWNAGDIEVVWKCYGEEYS